MKMMRVFHFVLLATVLFLELVHKLVLIGSLFPPQAAVFFVSRSDHLDQAGIFASSHEPRMVKIGICHRFTVVTWCSY